MDKLVFILYQEPLFRLETSKGSRPRCRKEEIQNRQIDTSLMDKFKKIIKGGMGVPVKTENEVASDIDSNPVNPLN